MNVRDLIPWGRQNSAAPVPYRSEESNPVLSFRREVDRLFDEAFRGFGRESRLMTWPQIETSESDQEIRITAEIPGLNEKDVELRLEDGVLTLRGEKKSEMQDKDRGYSERYYGRFERRIGLPDGVDAAGANASFRDGVLTVTLPKSPEAERGRRIPINATTKH